MFSKVYLLINLFFEAGAYGDARTPNWPYKHRTTLPLIVFSGVRRNKGEDLLE